MEPFRDRLGPAVIQTPAVSIASVTVHEESYPLKRPYVLSFTVLHHFHSLQVTIELSDGRTRTAEVVPLFGYSDESEEQIRHYLQGQCQRLVGEKLNAARAVVARDIPEKPFSTSPLLTAIDLFCYELNEPERGGREYVLPTAVQNTDGLLETVARHRGREATIKLKLSGQPKQDIAALRAVEDQGLWKALHFRLDANQAFSLGDAGQFFDYLRHAAIRARIEYVEQPLGAQDWQGHAELVRSYPETAVMLDESVVAEADLLHARDIGVNIVKLKLFKQGGIKELIGLAEKGVEIGMQVVLGNGVATWLSNKIELSIYDHHRALFSGACEANGFQKLSGEAPAFHA